MASALLWTSCGTQRLLRPLSGPCILLATAPTAPPCFGRRPQSSPLHHQRKNYLYFRHTGASADAPVCRFHGERSWRKTTAAAPASCGSGGAAGKPSQSKPAALTAPPSGELDATGGSGLRGFPYIIGITLALIAHTKHCAAGTAEFSTGRKACGLCILHRKCAL